MVFNKIVEEPLEVEDLNEKKTENERKIKVLLFFSCVYAIFVVPLHPILSRDGGIGRHEGLKILWPVMAVRVQVPLAVQKKKVLNMKMLGTFAFLNSNRSLGRK